MENNSKRPYPTGPGWWWVNRHGRQLDTAVVEVFIDGEELLWHDGVDHWLVEDDGNWLGPVPMPDDTPVESFSDAVSRMARILGMQAANDQRKACGESMAYTERDFTDEATP